MSDHEQIFVGVDGGGTGCRAVIGTANRVLGEGRGGPANATSDIDGAIRSVLDALNRARAAAGVDNLNNARSHIGLAGVLDAKQADTILKAMPFNKVVVTDDRPATLAGALGSNDGIVAAIGTGSFIGSRRGAEFRYIGGWGLILGDEASAAWLGRSALSETLLAHDRMQAETGLTNAVLDRFGNDPNTIVDFAATATPAEFGAFAPFVTNAAETGDVIATRLMKDGGSYIELAVANLKPKRDEPFCLTGGLGPSYAPYMSPAAQKWLRPAEGAALDGALSLARGIQA
ncbi:MAG: hypothetical protein KIH44_003065 [Octadecabacter sp.]|nr:hypothetical protein [Octadecabacter sp.]